MSMSRRTVLMLVTAALLLLVMIWVLTRGPAENQINIAHQTRPPSPAAAQGRPDLMQNVFRFPRPIALTSVQLVFLDAPPVPEDEAPPDAAGPTVWRLEPDRLFEPDETQAEDYRPGASVKTHVFSLGETIPGMMRTDGGDAGPLTTLVAGGHYRLEVTGEGLSGSYDFVVVAARRR